MFSENAAAPVRWLGRVRPPPSDDRQREDRREAHTRIARLLARDEALAARFERVTSWQRRHRSSEYHLTNACNIRCKGCWFFEGEFDNASREVKDLDAIEAFVLREAQERRINMALIIGGEPTLFPARIAKFVRHIRNVSISTNGLTRLPVEGFERVAIGISVFGGGPLDDALRAIRPGGSRFEGLFETSLSHYEDDPRATFIYAVTESGIAYVEPTVRRIRDNGNLVTFNFYSDYSKDEPIAQSARRELLDELLRVRALYPETVLSHPYYIETMVTGRSHWGSFGYDTCPSISSDHPAHASRLLNGHPTLPFFNTFAADLQSLAFCCTSGRCDGCRDSQAVGSWLLVNVDQFAGDLTQLRTWVELAESWWSQFSWSPYHRSAREEAALGAMA